MSGRLGSKNFDEDGIRMIEYILRALAVIAATISVVLIMPLTIFKQNPLMVPALGIVCVSYLLYFILKTSEYR